jgi:uncharacterized protein YebE (UPF0316 family)
MNEKLFITFVILNILNVIIQTIKSLATVKCGKTVASIVNAIAYGLYTVVVVYTVCDLPLWLKVVVVGVANLIGVYVVKLFEEKSRKDKLWKIEVTIPTELAEKVKNDLKVNHLPYNYIDIEKYFLFNVYCETQEQSNIAKVILDYYKAKYFVSETKNL